LIENMASPVLSPSKCLRKPCFKRPRKNKGLFMRPLAL
jgi:hypothetical protein